MSKLISSAPVDTSIQGAVGSQSYVPYYDPATEAPEFINPMLVVEVLWRRRLAIIIVTAVITILGTLAFKQVRPVYEAQATLLLEKASNVLESIMTHDVHLNINDKLVEESNFTNVDFYEMILNYDKEYFNSWDSFSFIVEKFYQRFRDCSRNCWGKSDCNFSRFLGSNRYRINRKREGTIFLFLGFRVKFCAELKLNIKLIRELQNGVKNEYRTNFLTKRNSF